MSTTIDHQVAKFPTAVVGNLERRASTENVQTAQFRDHEASEATIAACRDGDQDAFRQLYDAHHQSVCRLAVRIVGLQDAADVTQLIFLKVFGAIVGFKGEARFQTWLYRLAVNEALQHLRSNGRWRRHSQLDWEPIDESCQIDAPENKELLEYALARVSPDLRAIFLLREVEQLPYREIAAVLEISEGTVASRLNRSRRELQSALIALGWRP